jgi:Protein of unknown function (DUF3108)
MKSLPLSVLANFRGASWVNRRAVFVFLAVFLVHAALGISILHYEAAEILAATGSDGVVGVNWLKVDKPSIDAPGTDKSSDPKHEFVKKGSPGAKKAPSPTSKRVRGGETEYAPQGQIEPHDKLAQNSPTSEDRQSLGDPSSSDSLIQSSGGSADPTTNERAVRATPEPLSKEESAQSAARVPSLSTTSPLESEVQRPASRAEKLEADKAGELEKGSSPVRNLYERPLAEFPPAVRLSFAVHSPKDFDESSSSGSAELVTRSGVLESGAKNFGIDFEIKLGWLLSKVIGGTLRYQSQGTLGSNGPRTSRYSEKIGDRPERWLEVDGDKLMMKSHQIASLGVAPGTQDRLSVMWLLSMLARSDPVMLEKGQVFGVPMLSFRQVYAAKFESFGPEVLISPAGVLQTLHVGYKTQDSGGDKVDLWLGLDYEMQPVRIRWQEAQGRVIDMILQKKP